MRDCRVGHCMIKSNRGQLCVYHENHCERSAALLAVLTIWNTLPNSVVDVDTVYLFKARSDKVWMHQDVIYDFAANLTRISDRSGHEISGL